MVAWAEYFIEFGGFHEHHKKSLIRFMPGCNGACTRKDFVTSGGFVDMGAAEDVLFRESLRKSGSNIWFIPNIMIKHLWRTEKQKLFSNMNLLGNFFVISRKINQDIKYSNLINSSFYLPFIFLGRLLISAIYSIQAKKFGKFIISLPIIMSALNSFCLGINQVIQKKKMFSVLRAKFLMIWVGF
ncbi:MAG: hypothetical protein J4F36_04680 [Nitrosopumilaceae archaeon]|nr:hypothetical protein [Nitrosopumilaceae archaeon]